MIVLAAGGSTRLGHPKQLLPHLGRTLLRHAADVAVQAATGPVVVVLGAHGESIRSELDGLAVQVTMNRDWHTGIATSIQAGLGSVGRDREPDAVILMTEWNQFRNLDLERIKSGLKRPVFLDLRNVYEPARVAALGFRYSSVGRPTP